MKKYTHLFFDLDGTLWDLQRNTEEALRMMFMLHDHQLRSVSFDVFFARYHFHNDRVWALYRDGKIEREELRISRFERTFEDCGLKTDHAFVEEFADEFLRICPSLPHLLPGTIELLNALQPEYEMHIITNGFHEVQGIKMSAGGLNPYFGYVINSEDAGVKKPHAGIFHFALEKANAPVETSLMIGDDWDADILGARNVGMDQAFLTTTEDMMHSLGTVSKERPLRHNFHPTYSLKRIDDLRDILL